VANSALLQTAPSIYSKAPTQTIDTLWQMTQKVAPGEEWASINAGADVFVRIAGQ
jgi:hypothetical protein